jgi:23S rRNA-/tRNA-specific pseudouridylate synthase
MIPFAESMDELESPDPVPPVEPARILFLGEGLLAYDKPAGIPVHSGTGHPYGLAEAIEVWARRNPGSLPVAPAGQVAPLHRLDLEATGVVLLGIEKGVSQRVQEAFSAGEVKKRYLAVVAGPVAAEASIEGRVRSRLRRVYRHLPSRLDYRRLAGDERLSLVEVEPAEGRTHQIRCLFAAIDRPLAGDLRYGKPKPARQFLARFGLSHLLLHALELVLPGSVFGAPRSFSAPVPEAMRRLIKDKGWEVPGISG